MPPFETPVWWMLSKSMQYSLIICCCLVLAKFDNRKVSATLNFKEPWYDIWYSWVNLVVPKNWAAYFSAISGRKFDLTTRPSSARIKNLRPLLNRNIPLISGKYGLRNHSWPLESGFSHEQKWEKGAWSNETPPTPFFRSTRSQNSCQIKFSSRNNREIKAAQFFGTAR